jgi:hypothetical protein
LLFALRMGIDKLERWSAFRVLAADDPMREGDADPVVVGEALDQIADKMDQLPKYFEPKMPATFRFLAEALKDPGGATKTSVFGGVTSVENLIRFLGQRALGIATKSADAVEQHISKGVAAFLLTGLGGTALALSGALPASWTWLKPLLDAAAKMTGN